MMDEKLKQALTNLPPEKLDALLNTVQKSADAKKEHSAQADAGKQLGSLMDKVDKNKLNAILSDEKALETLLSSPQAKRLMGLLGKKP